MYFEPEIYVRSDVGLVPARGECALIGSDVSLYIPVMGPVVGYFSGRGADPSRTSPEQSLCRVQWS